MFQPSCSPALVGICARAALVAQYELQMGSVQPLLSTLLCKKRKRCQVLLLVQPSLSCSEDGRHYVWEQGMSECLPERSSCQHKVIAKVAVACPALITPPSPTSSFPFTLQTKPGSCSADQPLSFSTEASFTH